MKNLARISCILLIVTFLASCTQRRYSNLTVFKWHPGANKVKEKAKEKTFVDYQVEELRVKSRTESIEAPIELNQTVVEMEQVPQRVFTPLAIEGSKSKLKDAREVLPVMRNLKTAKKMVEKVKRLKSDNINSPNEKDDEIAGLIYWILVVILILLVLTLLRHLLGPLYGVFILIVLIALLGHILGIW